jgi:myosin XV
MEEFKPQHEFKPGDLVWFEAGLGFPLPGEIQEVHKAAQIVIVTAFIDGKVRNVNYC